MSASAPIGKSTAVAGSGPVAPEILWAQRSSEDEPEKVGTRQSRRESYVITIAL